MRLNHDCVRDVLLYIEENQRPGIFLTYSDFLNSDISSKYSKEDVEYTLIKLNETGFVNSDVSFIKGKIARFTTGGLTWNGHEFLDTIRDPEVWSNTKKVVSHLESVSMSMLSSIGSNVLNHMVDKFIGY